jgi:hypothetical protein
MSRSVKAGELLPGEAKAAAGKPTHAFDSSNKANAWLAANAAAPVIYPHKYGGWGPFTGEVREGLHTAVLHGRDIVIVLEGGANTPTVNQVRNLGRAMLDAGAITVRCQGKRIYPDGAVAGLFGIGR